MGELANLANKTKREGGRKPRREEKAGQKTALAQLGGIVKDLPRAIVGIPGDIKTEAVSAFKIATGDESVRKRRNETDEEHAQRVSPLIGAAAESFKNTGGRVTQSLASLAPGGLKPSETEYAKASAAGESVPLIVEDLANTLGVLSLGRFSGNLVASKAATRAPTLAANAARAAKVADLPFAAGRAGRTAAKTGAKRTYAAAADNPATLDALRFLKVDPDSVRARKEVFQPLVERAAELKSRAVEVAREAAKPLERFGPEAQTVRWLTAEKEADALALVRRQTPDKFEPFVTERYGKTVTLEAAHAAADVVDGRAPELAAAVSQSLATDAPEREARAQEYAASAPGREEQLGFDPLTAAEASSPLPKLRDKHARLEKQFDSVFNAAVRADAAALKLRQKLAERPTPGDPDAPRPPGIPAYENIVGRVAKESQAVRGQATDAARAAGKKARDAEIRNLKKQAVGERRRAAAEARSLAASLERDFLEAGRPNRPGKDHPLYDEGQLVEATLGPRRAQMDVWARKRSEKVAEAMAGGRGGDARTSSNDFDVWLEDWRARRNLPEDWTSHQVAEDFARLMKEVQDLRSQAHGIVNYGAGSAARDLSDDPWTETALRGTPDEAVEALDEEFGHSRAAAKAAAEGARRQTLDEFLTDPESKLGALSEKLRTEARPTALGGIHTRALRQGTRLGVAEARAKAATKAEQKALNELERLGERIAKEEAKLAEAITTAPARLRPQLDTNRAVARLFRDEAKALREAGLSAEAVAALDLTVEEAFAKAQDLEAAADALPQQLDQLSPEVHDAAYLPHLKPKEPLRLSIQKKGGLPIIRRLHFERLRKGDTEYERTIKAGVRAEWEAIDQQLAREAVPKIQGMFGKTGHDLGEIPDPEEWVAWDPAHIFQKKQNPTMDDVFIPKHLFDNFRSWHAPNRADQIARMTWDRFLTNPFRISVLALSPTWQLNNVLGNALLATIGAGVAPHRLAWGIAKAVKGYRASGDGQKLRDFFRLDAEYRGSRDWNKSAPRDLFGTGITHEQLGFMADATVDRGKLRQAAGWLPRKSFALNSFVDNVGRSAVYFAKKSKGMSDELAVKEALNAMGNFSKMTPFEKRFVRRVIPFYGWSRHITQLAFRLPIEHPMRVLWTLHLSNLYGSDEEIEGLIEHMQGAIPLGAGRLLGTNALNPFTDLGGPLVVGRGADQGAVANVMGGVGRSLHPALKLGLFERGITRGVNLFTGRPFTRPRGTGDYDDSGRQLPTPPPIQNQLIQMSPLARAIRAAGGYDSIVRYESGDPVLVGGRALRAEDRTPLRALARFFGAPITDLDTAKEITERAKKRREADRKIRERDERRLAREGL